MRLRFQSWLVSQTGQISVSCCRRRAYDAPVLPLSPPRACQGTDASLGMGLYIWAVCGGLGVTFPPPSHGWISGRARRSDCKGSQQQLGPLRDVPPRVAHAPENNTTQPNPRVSQPGFSAWRRVVFIGHGTPHAQSGTRFSLFRIRIVQAAGCVES